MALKKIQTCFRFANYRQFLCYDNTILSYYTSIHKATGPFDSCTGIRSTVLLVHPSLLLVNEQQPFTTVGKMESSQT
jgi:hypothetical protein